MNEKQYERLKPYLPVIEMYVKDKVYVGGGGIETMNQIYIELGNRSCCLSCPPAVGSMMEWLYRKMKEYESQKVFK